MRKLLEENSVDLFEIQSSAPGPGVAGTQLGSEMIEILRSIDAARSCRKIE
jgi:hypothetical protein